MVFSFFHFICSIVSSLFFRNVIIIFLFQRHCVARLLQIFAFKCDLWLIYIFLWLYIFVSSIATTIMLLCKWFQTKNNTKRERKILIKKFNGKKKKPKTVKYYPGQKKCRTKNFDCFIFFFIKQNWSYFRFGKFDF